MSTPADCRLIRRQRNTVSDLWDWIHLDLVKPAMIIIHEDGHDEIAFGAMQAGLDLKYSRSMVFFTEAGFEEVDDVSGSGTAELLKDGTLEVEPTYDLRDEAVLKAQQDTFSTAC